MNEMDKLMNEKKSENEIRLYGEVGGFGDNGFSSHDFSKALDAVKGDVTIYLNSLGGDVFEAMAIVARMRRHQGAKTVIIDGVAASSASAIAMGADRIVMFPGAMMMIHLPYAYTNGTAEELRSKAAALDESVAGIVELYAKRTGNTPDKIRAWMDDETWMNARTALERGFCDAIEGEDAEVSNESPAEKVTGIQSMNAFRRFRHAPPAVAGLAARCLYAATAAKGGKEQRMKQIMSALGLAEDAAEETAVQRIGALRNFEKNALSIADKVDTGDALKVFSAYREAAAKADGLQNKAAELEAKVAALETERLQTKIAAVIDSMKRAGKLVPAQEEWARTLGLKDLVSLEAFAASAPVIITKPVSAPMASASSKKFADMTPEERADLFRADRAAYEQLKQQSAD